MIESFDDRDMALSSGIAAFEAKQFTRAARLLSRLAAEGDAEARYRMAIMLQNASGWSRTRPCAPVHAERGGGRHALAQHGLGFMYLEGECTDKDPGQAARGSAGRGAGAAGLDGGPWECSTTRDAGWRGTRRRPGGGTGSRASSSERRARWLAGLPPPAGLMRPDRQNRRPSPVQRVTAARAAAWSCCWCSSSSARCLPRRHPPSGAAVWEAEVVPRLAGETPASARRAPSPAEAADPAGPARRAREE